MSPRNRDSRPVAGPSPAATFVNSGEVITILMFSGHGPGNDSGPSRGWAIAYDVD